jgi:hypothetical protein
MMPVYFGSRDNLGDHVKIVPAPRPKTLKTEVKDHRSLIIQKLPGFLNVKLERID